MGFFSNGLKVENWEDLKLSSDPLLNDIGVLDKNMVKIFTEVKPVAFNLMPKESMAFEPLSFES